MGGKARENCARSSTSTIQLLTNAPIGGIQAQGKQTEIFDHLRGNYEILKIEGERVEKSRWKITKELKYTCRLHDPVRIAREAQPDV
jgi:hypothetical protein